MKNLLITVALALLAILLCVACGGKSDKEHPAPDAADLEAAELQNTRLARALTEGHVETASAMADSMSLFVDDLTPDQTVQVLMAFLTVHNEAVARKDTRRDLETLRKYVDVYDIALSVNPSDTRAAFDKARKVNPAVDLDSLATSFRERLTQYDAIHDGSLTTTEPADTETVTVDTANTVEEIPLELRPAE
jgi:hypothetical protein